MNILSIGTATVDYIVSLPNAQNGKKVCFDAGRKYEITAPHMYAGGGALNASITFARAGHTTTLISEWGNDVGGAFLENHIRSESIIPHVMVTRTYPTATSFVLVSENGERTVLTSRGALKDFSYRDISSRSLRNNTWAYVVTSSWSAESILHILQLLKKSNIRIALSPSAHFLSHAPKCVAEVFRASDIVILNQEEAALAVHSTSKHIQTLFSKLDALVPGIVVMTCGEKGAYVSDGSRVFFSRPIHPNRVVDKTGAGDALGSGFVTGLVEFDPYHTTGLYTEESIIYALRRGIANATSVVEHYGATEGILTRKQFLTQKRWKDFEVKIKHI